jgi:hypothetical protein
MTRTYKPVRPKAPREARMRRAARLRDEGKSLREIAAIQEVSHETVRRDLAAWDEKNAPAATVSHLPVTKTPPRGGNVTPECDSEAAPVLQLRKPA